MNTLCICYDLNKPGQDYTKLCDAIKNLGTWWHHLDSTWLVVTNSTPAQARDYLKQFIDLGDELLVFNVGTGWAGQGFSEECYQWLRDNWHSA